MRDVIGEIEQARASVRAPAWDAATADRTLAGLHRRRRRAAANRIATAVGAVLMVAGGAATVWRLLPGGPRIDDAFATRAPTTEPLQRLADGSTAHALGPTSELYVREDAPKRTVVTVARGAGRFEVVKDARRVFRVEAPPVTVTALGTAFTVSLLDEKVAVVVDEGRVLVEWPGGSRQVAARESGLFPPDAPAAEPSPTRPEGVTTTTQALRDGCRTVYGPAVPALEPGDLSHWAQPWRSYQATVPARRMREAPAFTLPTRNTDRERARADVFAGAGFRRAIVEFQWQDVDPATPNRLGWRREGKRAALALLAARGVRPIVLVDAFATLPRVELTLTLAAPAAQGARQIHLDPASVPRVVPGRTLLAGERAFITAVQPSGVATLSRPLAREIPGGPLRAGDVVFPPFPRPVLADGAPNPAFEEPMRGWLDFVAATTADVKDVLGSDAFDLLVFNGPNSPVLDADAYHDPPLGPAGVPVEATTREVLARTVAWVRDPRNGVAGARVIDGFMNRRWGDGGGATVGGVDAYSRHLSAVRLRFPPEGKAALARWVDVVGTPSGTRGADGRWRDAFTPRYSALFPEVFLTALTPIQMVPDLSPAPTRDAAGAVRWRGAAPAGGAPPEVAITAFSVWPDRARDGSGLSADETRRAITKSALRALSAYVGSGAGLLGFYEASPATQLAVEKDASGGETMRALTAFLGAFSGPDDVGAPRPLTLSAVTDCSARRQFDGDGTDAHPALLDRDLVAFYPFQTATDAFVAPVYVMTRDVAEIHAPAAHLRTERAPHEYTLDLEGVRGEAAVVSARDPITGAEVPVEVTARGPASLQVRLPLTDYPRLLHVRDGR